MRLGLGLELTLRRGLGLGLDRALAVERHVTLQYAADELRVGEVEEVVPGLGLGLG